MNSDHETFNEMNDRAEYDSVNGKSVSGDDGRAVLDGQLIYKMDFNTAKNYLKNLGENTKGKKLQLLERLEKVVLESKAKYGVSAEIRCKLRRRNIGSTPNSTTGKSEIVPKDLVPKLTGKKKKYTEEIYNDQVSPRMDINTKRIEIEVAKLDEGHNIQIFHQQDQSDDEFEDKYLDATPGPSEYLDFYSDVKDSTSFHGEKLSHPEMEELQPMTQFAERTDTTKGFHSDDTAMTTAYAEVSAEQSKVPCLAHPAPKLISINERLQLALLSGQNPNLTAEEFALLLSVIQPRQPDLNVCIRDEGALPSVSTPEDIGVKSFTESKNTESADVLVSGPKTLMVDVSVQVHESHEKVVELVPLSAVTEDTTIVGIEITDHSKVMTVSVESQTESDLLEERSDKENNLPVRISSHDIIGTNDIHTEELSGTPRDISADIEDKPAAATESANFIQSAWKLIAAPFLTRSSTSSTDTPGQVQTIKSPDMLKSNADALRAESEARAVDASRLVASSEREENIPPLHLSLRSIRPPVPAEEQEHVPMDTVPSPLSTSPSLHKSRLSLSAEEAIESMASWTELRPRRLGDFGSLSGSEATLDFHPVDVAKERDPAVRPTSKSPLSTDPYRWQTVNPAIVSLESQPALATGVSQSASSLMSGKRSFRETGWQDGEGDKIGVSASKRPREQSAFGHPVTHQSDIHFVSRSAISETSYVPLLREKAAKFPEWSADLPIPQAPAERGRQSLGMHDSQLGIASQRRTQRRRSEYGSSSNAVSAVVTQRILQALSEVSAPVSEQRIRPKSVTWHDTSAVQVSQRVDHHQGNGTGKAGNTRTAKGLDDQSANLLSFDRGITGGVHGAQPETWREGQSRKRRSVDEKLHVTFSSSDGDPTEAKVPRLPESSRSQREPSAGDEKSGEFTFGAPSQASGTESFLPGSEEVSDRAESGVPIRFIFSPPRDTGKVKRKDTPFKAAAASVVSETTRPSGSDRQTSAAVADPKTDVVSGPIKSIWDMPLDTVKCQVCLVPNKKSAAKCVACENPIGTPASKGGPPSTGPFGSTAPTPATTTHAPAGFTFGASVAPSTAPATAALGMFGAAPPTFGSVNPPLGAFTAGAATNGNTSGFQFQSTTSTSAPIAVALPRNTETQSSAFTWGSAGPSPPLPTASFNPVSLLAENSSGADQLRSAPGHVGFKSTIAKEAPEPVPASSTGFTFSKTPPMFGFGASMGKPASSESPAASDSILGSRSLTAEVSGTQERTKRRMNDDVEPVPSMGAAPPPSSHPNPSAFPTFGFTTAPAAVSAPAVSKAPEVTAVPTVAFGTANGPPIFGSFMESAKTNSEPESTKPVFGSGPFTAAPTSLSAFKFPSTLATEKTTSGSTGSVELTAPSIPPTSATSTSTFPQSTSQFQRNLLFTTSSADSFPSATGNSKIGASSPLRQSDQAAYASDSPGSTMDTGYNSGDASAQYRPPSSLGSTALFGSAPLAAASSGAAPVFSSSTTGFGVAFGNFTPAVSTPSSFVFGRSEPGPFGAAFNPPVPAAVFGGNTFGAPQTGGAFTSNSTVPSGFGLSVNPFGQAQGVGQGEPSSGGFSLGSSDKSKVRRKVKAMRRP